MTDDEAIYILNNKLNTYYCSNCHKAALEQEEYPYLSSYCPFCGAEMEIEEDENKD